MSKFNRRTRVIASAATVALSAGLTTACSGGSSDADTLTIGYQPGLMYAPIVVASKQDCFERELPETTVSIRQLNAGSALRDAQLAGDIQVGVYGLGAFLVGWANGVNWKALESVADSELTLMVNDPGINSLEKLAESGGQIAVPALDSPQVALMKTAAKERLGDPAAFDTMFTVMGHPDAVQALSSGQVAAHFATPPFIEQEKDFGAKPLVTGSEVLGTEATTVLFAAEDDWVEENPEVVDAMNTCMEEARAAITEDVDQAAAWLSEDVGGAQSPEDVKAQLTSGEITFTDELHGVVEFGQMMKDIGMIEKAPESMDDIAVAEAPQG